MKEIVEAAYAAGRSFVMVLVAFQKDYERMGFPADSIPEAEDTKKPVPLVLEFPASHLRFIITEIGSLYLHASLSFDALYSVQIPWSFVAHINVQGHLTMIWPVAPGEEEPPQQPPAQVAVFVPTPDVLPEEDPKEKSPFPRREDGVYDLSQHPRYRGWFPIPPSTPPSGPQYAA